MSSAVKDKWLGLNARYYAGTADGERISRFYAVSVRDARSHLLVPESLVGLRALVSDAKPLHDPVLWMQLTDLQQD